VTVAQSRSCPLLSISPRVLTTLERADEIQNEPVLYAGYLPQTMAGTNTGTWMEIQLSLPWFFLCVIRAGTPLILLALGHGYANYAEA